MKILGYIFSGTLLIGLFHSCVNPPDYPDQPQIEYIGLNKKSIAQGNGNSPADTLEIIFSFTDGDGDLGTPAKDTVNFDVFLQDSRDSSMTKFRLPVLPDQGVGNGVSGEATVRIPSLLNICCTFPNGATPCQPSIQFPTDTFSYSIQLRDRAGNLSNKVQTEMITVLCK
jgi:hypothetical protein